MIWYLSFVDPAIAATIPLEEQRLGGPAWLGACLVDAPSLELAVASAHLLGCDPGGEVMIFGPVPAVMVPPKWLNRLLGRDDIDQFDAETAERSA